MTSSKVVIEPKVDAYGTYARAGALADYLEVHALHGNSITAAELEDIAEEQGWHQKDRNPILSAGADDADTWSELAFGTIDARIDILGHLYPFTLQDGGLAYAGEPDPTDDHYLALLAISVVHAWGIASSVQPTVALEDVVRRVLDGRHLLAADMGTGDRHGLSFEDNLLKQGRHCGLSPERNPLPRARKAKDAGVDTLGSLIWPDNRRGQWVFIGQATCGSSLTWARKLKEPEPERWRKYLQEAIAPQVFLAVPHHIDHRQWDDLMAARQGILLDRLRMCAAKGKNSPDERTLITALLEAEPQ